MPRLIPDRRRDTAQAQRRLLVVHGEALGADPLERRCQLRGGTDRVLSQDGQSAFPHDLVNCLRRAPGEDRLAQRRAVAVRALTDLDRHLHGVGARNHFDVDDLTVRHDPHVGRLVEGVTQSDHQGARHGGQPHLITRRRPQVNKTRAQDIALGPFPRRDVSQGFERLQMAEHPRPRRVQNPGELSERDARVARERLEEGDGLLETPDSVRTVRYLSHYAKQRFIIRHDGSSCG